MKRNKGYIRLADESITSKPWELPDYNETDAPRETAINFDPAWSNAEDIDDSEVLNFSALTAETLEEIRQSALDEGLKEGRKTGFSEGKDAGFTQGKEEGFAQGKAEGYEKGLAEAEETIREHCAHLEAMVSKLAFPIKQIDHQVQIQIIEIISEISKAVLKIEMETNPKVILQTLQDAVAAMPISKRSLTIYLHPVDKKIIETAFDENTLEQYNWKLLAEPNFSRGDIQVDCVDSSIHYSMADRIEEALARFMAKNTSAEPEVNDLSHAETNIDYHSETRAENGYQQEIQTSESSQMNITKDADTDDTQR